MRRLELNGTRSPNAEAVFRNCYKHLRKTQDDTVWKLYEANKDARLKNQGTYGMDSRELWFAAETRAEYDRLSLIYPGHILLCDRTMVQDTKSEKCVDGTTKLHEICSVATSMPTIHPRVWPVLVSDLPCNCQHCIVDRTNDKCIYSPWRRTHQDTMKIGCVGPIEAQSWVGRAVTRVVNGQPLIGVIASFFPKLKKWELNYVSSGNIASTESYTYAQMCALNYAPAPNNPIKQNIFMRR